MRIRFFRRFVMKKSFAAIAALALAAVMGVSFAVAAEPAGYDADARIAEGNPPVIPHKIVDNATGKSCLSCHLAEDRAPLCPHPDRIYCTSCHVRSELGAPAQDAAKGKKGKGR